MRHKPFQCRNRKSLNDNRLHDCVQGKGVVNVQKLKHDQPDAGIRRPNGLTDQDWDFIVMETTRAVLRSRKPASFMQEMVKLLTGYPGNKAFSSILKSLGIEPAKGVFTQNWEHTAFRFFRHFCPEDYRNAINHSGLKFAVLEFDGVEFAWVARAEVHVSVTNKALDLVDAKPGDTVSITAKGLSDVETVTIQNGKNVFIYYKKGISASFGNTMYYLKQAIVKNKVEALRSTIQKQND